MNRHSRLLLFLSLSTTFTLTLGAIPATYAWYRLVAPVSISVASATATITVAKPDYGGTLTLQSWHVLTPSIGQLPTNTDGARTTTPFYLTPVSTADGSSFYYKRADKDFVLTSDGYYRFLLRFNFSNFPSGLSLRLRVHLTNPKQNGEDRPTWLRLHLNAYQAYNLDTQSAPVNGILAKWQYDGYFVANEFPKNYQGKNIVKGIKNTKGQLSTGSLKALDASDVIVIDNKRAAYAAPTNGDIYVLGTLYLEGTMADNQDENLTLKDISLRLSFEGKNIGDPQ